MRLPNVYMKDQDGNIGSRYTGATDTISGLLFDISAQADFWTAGQGKNIAETFKDSVVEFSSLKEAEEAGITPFSEDEGAENLLQGVPYYHIKQFFEQAGDGTRLFVSFADCKNDFNAIVDMQRASGGMINQFGVWTEQSLWKNMDTSAATYSLNLLAELQSIGETMADDYFAPAVILLSANTSKVQTSSGTDGKVVFSKIPNCRNQAARYVSVLLSQDIDIEVRKMQGALASTTPVGIIGLALGTVSKANVGNSIGWVRQFPLGQFVSGIEMGFGDAAVADGVITNGTSYNALTSNQLDALHTNGYIFMRTFAGLEGQVYFSTDSSCSDGDFHSISNNRTINKSRRAVRTALLPYVNSPIKVDPSNGNLSAAQITLMTTPVQEVLEAMVTAEEISAIGKITIPAQQNILRDRKLTLSYTLVPLGCAEEIEVVEGLVVSRK